MTYDENIIPDPLPTNPRFTNLSGCVFYQLTVQFFLYSLKGQSFWVCLCSCGNKCVAPTGALKCGDTRSCGCLRQSGKNRIQHGGAKTRIYAIWCGIRSRCTNPNNWAYKWYGARGIRMCSGWDSFPNFLKDMGEPPTNKHSVDRINNDGNYSCGHCEQCRENNWDANCKWSTQKEQANNSRKNHTLTFQGKTQSISAWSTELNITQVAIHSRLQRGWDIEKTLSTPVRPHRPYRTNKSPS